MYCKQKNADPKPENRSSRVFRGGKWSVSSGVALLHYYTTTLLHYYTTTLLHYYTTLQHGGSLDTEHGGSLDTEHGVAADSAETRNQGKVEKLTKLSFSGRFGLRILAYGAQRGKETF